MWEKTEKTQKLEQSFWNEVARSTEPDKNAQNLHNVIRQDIWFAKLIELLENVREKRILDCGCGIGNLSAYLAMRSAHIEGFDISLEALKIARANAEENDTNGKCNFLCCTFEDLPYQDASFDLAVGAYILHHVNIERSLKELHRVLKPRGKGFFIETWGKNHYRCSSKDG